MTRFTRVAMLLAAALGALSGGLALAAGPAAATQTGPIQVVSCRAGWYVNPDEGHLLPVQKPEGLLFDGPSLVHHQVPAVTRLADAPATLSFETTGPVTGVKPLFKMETSAPYSTVNVLANGKVWSSKIASGPGSQADPVNGAGLLVGLGTYTNDTKISTFGVGYASDAGNKALVSSIRFGEQIYDLTCVPPTTKPTTPPTTKPTTPPTTKPTAPAFTCAMFVDKAAAQRAYDSDPRKYASLDSDHDGRACEVSPASSSPAVAGPSLPVTGPGVGAIAGAGVLILTLGAGAMILARRRRNSFIA